MTSEHLSQETTVEKPTGRRAQVRKLALNRRAFLKTTGVGATVGLGGCIGQLDDDDDVITIGSLYPLTGPVGETAAQIQQLIDTAAEEIVNKERPELNPLILAEDAGLPNLGGAEVEVVWADHRGDAAEGRAEAERMIQDQGADVLYGAYHSAVSMTVSATAEREQVPHITGESSSPDLTERGLEWFWRTGPHDGIFTENMFEMFEDMNDALDAGLETVAIMHEDTEFGAVSRDVQVELADQFGYEIVEGPIAYTAEEVTSFTSELERIRAADPDILLPTSYVRDAIIMKEDMRSIGWFPDIVMAQNAGHIEPSFTDQTDLSEYVCSRSTFADDMMDVVEEIGIYNDFMVEHTGIRFNGVFIRSWAGFLITCKAIDEAGSTDPGDVQNALNTMELEALESGLPFGYRAAPNGQNELATGVIVQIRGGDQNLVWPFDLAGEDAIAFPAPGWDER